MSDAAITVARGESPRLSPWDEGGDWHCSFTVDCDEQQNGEETPIGVDVGHNYVLAATPDDASAASFLMSGKEHKFVRQYYRSLRDSLQETGALRARTHLGNKEYRRIKDMNHTLSKRLMEYASQFSNPVIKPEKLENIRDGSEWNGVHSWPFYELQQFITYKAEKEGIRVENVKYRRVKPGGFTVLTAHPKTGRAVAGECNSPRPSQDGSAGINTRTPRWCP